MSPALGEVLRLGEFYEVLTEKELEGLRGGEAPSGRHRRNPRWPVVSPGERQNGLPPFWVQALSLQGARV